MKLSPIILLLFALITSGRLNAQPSELKFDEMLEDFDELVMYLTDFAVHKDLNTIRLGIDYEREFRKLRYEISTLTSPCEFREILHRATRLVQDLHCGPMDYSYLSNYGKYQNKFNFKSKEQSYLKLKAFEELCDDKVINLSIPIFYANGTYQCYADFIYNGETITKGSVVTNINGSDINHFIETNPDKVWPIKVDSEGRKYNDRFYQKGSENVTLTFENKGDEKKVTFNLIDTVKYVEKLVREVYYFSQKRPQIHISNKYNILYLGLPSMDSDVSKKLVKKLDSVSAQWKNIEKIVIDIRGNPGGSDLAWRELLKHIIPNTISFEVNLKYRYNDRTKEHYASKKNVLKESIPLLNNAPYWSEEKVTIQLKPDKNSMNFTGDIYVLQDPYIYSSAGNFSNLCLTSDQLISVGSRTDLVGGLQKEPLFFQLKNSGLIFRVEPVLDFSNVECIKDFEHNEVEVHLAETIEDRYLRTHYLGDLYGWEFLFTHDYLFKYIISE